MSTAATSRLPVRVPPHIRARAEQAAELRGLSLNALIVYAVAEMADQIIQGEHVIRLTETGTKRFFRLLKSPPKPNAALTRLAKKHRPLPRG